MPKLWLTLEVAAVFILLMCQIWIWPNLGILAALPILLALISWHLRKDNLKTLGIKPEWPSKKIKAAMFVSFAIFWLIILICGIIWNPAFFYKARLGVFWLNYAKMSFGYCFWAFFQQLWLCGYFVNRLDSIFKNNTKTILLSGVLFAIVHLPNPVLTATTFVGGMLSAYFFLKAKNLYILALAHGILGPSIRLFLNYTLRIGPGFFN